MRRRRIVVVSLSVVIGVACLLALLLAGAAMVARSPYRYRAFIEQQPYSLFLGYTYKPDPCNDGFNGISVRWQHGLSISREGGVTLVMCGRQW